MNKLDKFSILLWLIVGVLSLVALFKNLLVNNLGIENINTLTNLIFIFASIIQIVYLVKKKNQHFKNEDATIDDKLLQLLKEGKDVQAVKHAREALGLSLVEGKQYIDTLKRELGE
ncbi:hypothetical protein [Tenuibacillus multivorans]|uniref:Ribosomal protein L7/L12 C-terminal domain-containing protein n=1 Tax=Tenuibacillus multivorans TaxID=237069 RepID=A0A1H0B4F5_9BACI|nr:hypothetical protein [Tenuibacillus multivorans]GEL77531.1 hypothetical protein TMU01_17660 [Tenuibacillus multivorans]SDN40557.1 hypothetical protein SAMN05216498_2215 [Tenuibacillus multivorans]